MCKELQRACDNRHVHALALLCELLVARPSEAEVEAKCAELEQCHDDFQAPCDDDGAPNPWFAERPEFVWGAVLSSRFGRSRRPPKELSSWLELVRAHFPSSPALARETAERLLREGEAWRRGSGSKNSQPRS
jgi:hypothetical protein